jgi:hypothetical protein
MRYPTPSRSSLIILLALFASSCFLGKGESGPDDVEVPDPIYDCERDDFPCTPGEVDESVHVSGAELMEAARKRLADGESMPDVAEWLRAKDEVVSAEANEVSLIFRPKGGRPLVMHDGVAAARPGESSQQQLQPSKNAEQRVRRSMLGTSDVDEFVVGSDRDEDGRRDVRKKALVLDPFEWQLEDGYTVRGDDLIAALEQTYDYRDNIEYVTNEEVGVIDFRGFDDYDLIYVGSHGGTLTGANGAASFILTGREIDSCGELRNAADLANVFGIYCAALNVGGWKQTRSYISVIPRFFTREYGNGLNDALVILDGCRSGRPYGTAGSSYAPSTLLTSALIGERTAVYGWTDDVETRFAEQAMKTLFKYLIEYGLPAETSLEFVCAADRCFDDARDAELVLYEQFDSDIRAVEMLELYVMEGDPPRRVESGLDLPALVLGNVGDGQPDSIAVVPQLKGIFEPEAWDYLLEPEIDGETLEGSPIELTGPAGAEEIAPYTYRPQIPAILPLNRDIEDGENVSVGFRVGLPHKKDWAGAHSFSPLLEHTFGACSVEMELTGAHSATLSGTSAEYDLPSESISLMALDPDGEPAFVTAELSDGQLSRARLTYEQDVMNWSTNSDEPGTIDLTDQSGAVAGTLVVTFPVTDTSTTTLTATFDAIVDDDGNGRGCVY